jgi:hypothetical protein
MILKRSSNQIGNSFEQIILASQRGIIRLVHWPKCGAEFIGKDRITARKIAWDFSGCVVGKGTHICFDAKATKDPDRFDIGNPKIVKPHQRYELILQGEGKSISGLLIGAEHHRTAYWLPWHVLRGVREPSIRWDDPRLVLVAEPGKLIDFERIVRPSTDGKELT